MPGRRRVPPGQILRRAGQFRGELRVHPRLVGEQRCRAAVALVGEPLILWRRHGDNVTGGSTTAKQKLLWRLRIISALLKV